jgi:hypothetical protein
MTSYLSVPAGAVALGIILFAMPNGFPFHGIPKEQRPNSINKLSLKWLLARFDLFGATLLLAATLLLVAALEEADVHYPWKSAFVITLLTISGLSWVGFLLWERHMTQNAKVCEPVFPWRFVESRVLLGMIL